MYTGELYGRWTNGRDHLSRHGQLDGHLALGSCHILLYHLLWRALVLCQTWTSSVCFDLVLIHLPEYRFDRKFSVTSISTGTQADYSSRRMPRSL
jgi:hypothetical protein